MCWQEADGDDRLGLQVDLDAECDGDPKGDTPDVPLSTSDTDNTPQCLNKALEGLPPRYPPPPPPPPPLAFNMLLTVQFTNPAV